MAAKVSKLEEQFKFDAPREKQREGSCSNIFGGVSIYVNGYTGKTRAFGLLYGKSVRNQPLNKEQLNTDEAAVQKNHKK